jgi:hypothetical protein
MTATTAGSCDGVSCRNTRCPELGRLPRLPNRRPTARPYTFGMNGTLVTGANKGIEGLDASLIGRDVTDAASIEQCVTCIERDVGRLDVLVNNAGILGRPEPSETQLDEVRRYPTWLCAWFDAIAYPASKSALDMVTVQYAKELANTGINGQRRRSRIHGDRLQRQPRHALLDEDGPTGGFFDARGRLPW